MGAGLDEARRNSVFCSVVVSSIFNFCSVEFRTEREVEQVRMRIRR